MNELIQITTNEQGSEVVSGRELYEFLEVKSKFADWIKNRIIKYGFLEEDDYVLVSKILETNNPKNPTSEIIDYALSLDMAKELSMVEHNAKGKQARAYFIERDKRLKQLATQPVTAPVALSAEQVLLQQAYKLVAQQEQIDQLRQDVNRLMAGQKPASTLRTTVALQSPTPPLTTRQLISRRINEYCERYGATQHQTYSYLYKQMHSTYGVSMYRLPRRSGESILDAVERSGHIDRLYSLLLANLTLPDESNQLNLY